MMHDLEKRLFIPFMYKLVASQKDERGRYFSLKELLLVDVAFRSFAH